MYSCGMVPSHQGPAVRAARRTPLSHLLALCVYWLSNTLLWGALLHLALQSRLADWYPERSVGMYMGLLGFFGGTVGTASQVIFGAFSDRSAHRMGRRRPFVIAGSLTAGASLLLLGLAASFWPFVLALMLLQLTSNLALGPFTALLPDTVPKEEHGIASGFMGVARLLGDTGGLVLAGTLLSVAALKEAGRPPAEIDAFKSGRMFLLCGIMASFILFTMLFTVVAIRERPLAAQPPKSGWDIAASAFRVNVRGHPDFFWLSLSRAVTNFGCYTFLEYLRYFMQYTLKVPDPEKGTMYVLLPAIGAALVSSLPAGAISDRFGRKPVIYAAQFLMAAGALGFTLAPSPTFAMIAAIPTGVGYGIFTAVEWAFACNLLPAGDAARYLGFWNVSMVIPQIAAFALMGPLGSLISRWRPGLGWRVDFLVAVAFALLGAWFLRPIREVRPGSER